MSKEPAETVEVYEDQEPVYELKNGLVIVKDGFSVVDRFLNDAEYQRLYNRKPDKVVHNASIDDIKSFINFVNEYKDDDTKLFYNDSEVRAVFNYHSQGTEADNARRCDSKAFIMLRPTEVFGEFKDLINTRLDQRGFVRFLKKAERFIVTKEKTESTDEISSATIIEIAQALSSTKEIDSVERNSQRSFSINIEVKSAKQNVKIPEKLTFEMRPFFCSQETGTFTVELFITGTDGGFYVELMSYDIDEVVEDVTNKIVENVLTSITSVDSFRVAEGSFPEPFTQPLKPSEKGYIKMETAALKTAENTRYVFPEGAKERY